MKNNLTIVVGLFGRYEMMTKEFHEKIVALEQLENDFEVILVADGEWWENVPLYSMLQVKLPKAKIFVNKEKQNLPAVLYNIGLKNATRKYITFSNLLSKDFFVKQQIFQRKINGLEKKHEESTVFFIERIGAEYPPLTNIYGYTQAKLYFSIDELCIPVKILQNIGGFDEFELLQCELDRWLILKLSLQVDFDKAGELQSEFVTLFDVFSCDSLYGDHDLNKRYAIYSNSPLNPVVPAIISQKNFLNDLPINDAKKISFFDKESDLKEKKKPRYKIMILGGYWEYHHNQICFLNYLESLQGSGFATYQVEFEYNMSKIKLLEYDLIIFTRCRSKNAVELSRFCKEKHIASIYMLDDNWFSIAKDYKEYENIFLPGREPFDNFIDILTNCTTAWVYNDLIMHEVLPYIAHVEKFNIAIAPEVFQQVQERKRTNEILYIGFAGSRRFDDRAFRALARYARRHSNIKLVLLGNLSVEQEILFKNLSTEKMEFTNYAKYSKNITKLAPDLLIAPLEDNLTMRSKCYNKYIESGAIGSVCIYSQVPPYTDIIIDNYNGYYVEEDTEDGWYCKIEEVVANIEKLRIVQNNARQDIEKNHTVKNFLFQFVEKITKIIETEVI